MKKLLLSLLFISSLVGVAFSQGTTTEEIIRYNKKKLSEYSAIDSHADFQAAWKKLASFWLTTRKDLLDWPVASEKEQIEKVDLFYTFLKNNEAAISQNQFGKNSAIRLGAESLAGIIERTNWSVIINREAYSFYPLLVYLKNKY